MTVRTLMRISGVIVRSTGAAQNSKPPGVDRGNERWLAGLCLRVWRKREQNWTGPSGLGGRENNAVRREEGGGRVAPRTMMKNPKEGLVQSESYKVPMISCLRDRRHRGQTSARTGASFSRHVQAAPPP